MQQRSCIFLFHKRALEAVHDLGRAAVRRGNARGKGNKIMPAGQRQQILYKS
jgi:hypothetical protein